MIDIGISNLAKSYGVDKIFENITFDIKDKERVGLVGKNGVGKSTLLKIINGVEEATSGQINKRKGLKIGYLEQIPTFSNEMVVEDVLKLSFKEIYDIETEMKKAQKQLENLKQSELDEAVTRFSLLQDKYEIAGGYKVKEKLDKIVIGLEFSENMLKSKFSKLSGGEKTRVVLGKILLESPDVLLLDEPSNHLDIKTVEWLEDYLSNYEGTVVIVSHDRYFLDKVANKIVELSSEGAYIYNGNYSKYVIQKELRFLQAMKEYESQQKKIKRMEEQIHRYRVWGAMRDSDKMYRRAKELEKRLTKIDELKKPVKDKKIRSFNLTSSERSGKDVIRVEDICKTFGDRQLLKDASFTLYYKDSLAILGENGTGKSTLLKMILDQIPIDSGNIYIGSKVTIGYLPQDVKFENEELQIIDYFSYKYSISTSDARRELAKVLFTDDDIYKKISSLSGGEKTRLKLLTLMYEKANLLILDEPTNHLDIDSRESLEEDLINYEGTILFVSHDRYFIDKVATRIAEIENKSLRVYDFDYEGYKNEKEKVKLAEEEKIRNEQTLNPEKFVSQNKEDYLKAKENTKRIEKKKRDLKKLEDKIMELEEDIKKREETLYNNNNDDLNKQYTEFTTKKEELAKLYEDLESMYSDEELSDIL